LERTSRRLPLLYRNSIMHEAHQKLEGHAPKNK
jgi:hypothetical protein